MLLSLCGCALHGSFAGELVDAPPHSTVVAPAIEAEVQLMTASANYDKQVVSEKVDLMDLSLRTCLVLAVRQNRGLRQSTYATQRIGLDRDIELSELDQADLFATYSIEEGPDRSDARVGAVARRAGFEVTPFIEFMYDDVEDDPAKTSFGVAVSRSIFRIKHEHIRQHLALTRATKDFHVAINERILLLRELHLAAVQRFYEVYRFAHRVKIRLDRVSDASTFLAGVHDKVNAGILAPVEATNAEINLNQAQADLVREQTILRNAKESLLNLLGLDLDLEVRIRDEDLTGTAFPDLELGRDVALVREHHERVRNQQLEMEVRRQTYLVSRDELVPDLQGTLTAARDVDRGGELDRVSFDMSLSVPMDGYRAERARMTQDRLRIIELTVRLEAIRSNLERQLRVRYRAIQQLTTTVALAEKRLATERKKLATTLKRFENGEIGNLEVTRAKQDVDNASVELLNARINRITEQASYQSLLPGSPDEYVGTK